MIFSARQLIFLAMLGLSIFVGPIGCQTQEPAVSATAPAQNTALARIENERGLKLIEQEKYTEAEPVLNRAIAADVTFGPARNNRGLLYYHTHRLYLAAWEFENAIKLMPYQPEPRNNLGLVFEKAGKLDEAIGAYEKARAMQPDNPEFIGNLARARVQQGGNDAETRKLLDEVVMKDTRAEWRHWARLTLFKLRRSESDTAATQPIRP